MGESSFRKSSATRDGGYSAFGPKAPIPVRISRNVLAKRVHWISEDQLIQTSSVRRDGHKLSAGHCHSADCAQEEMMARLELVHGEMQAAFKHCALLPRIAKVGGHTLYTSSPFRARRDPSIQPRPHSVSRDSKDSGDKPEAVGHSPTHVPSGRRPNKTNVTELVPRTQRPGSLHYPQRSDVPARVLPRAQISPGLTLSPKERMRIEFETRRPPKPPERPCMLPAVQNNGKASFANNHQSSRSVC
jgi:hypothetical protein